MCPRGWLVLVPLDNTRKMTTALRDPKAIYTRGDWMVSAYDEGPVDTQRPLLRDTVVNGCDPLTLLVDKNYGQW